MRAAAKRDHASVKRQKKAAARVSVILKVLTTPRYTSVMTTKTETFQFQAEARQVLDLMIHSLYTNKEIFLRELISNASDALDRLRFEALSNPDLIDKDDRMEIVIESDSNARTVTVHDNGIGMSRDDVISHIGTIAKSGTRELLQSL